MKNTILKYTLIIYMLFIIVSLSGCIEVKISGEINSDFMTTYQGDIELNLSKYDYSQQALAQEGLLKLSEYWQSIGYESQVVLDNKKYSIYFKKQIQCSSYDEAFAELFHLMTDEYSPFTSLEYIYTPYSNYSEYTINGSIDITNILDEEVYNSLNDEIKQTINTQLENLNASVEFVLPNQESFNQPSSLSETFTTPILADTVTTFSFEGKIYNPDMTEDGRSIIDKYNYYNKLKYIFAGILLILVILTLVLIRKLNKK